MLDKLRKIFVLVIKKLGAFFRWYKNLYKGRAWYTKTILGFCSSIVAFFLYLGSFAFPIKKKGKE